VKRTAPSFTLVIPSAREEREASPEAISHSEAERDVHRGRFLLPSVVEMTGIREYAIALGYG
jgi:hypothetical protein